MALTGFIGRNGVAVAGWAALNPSLTLAEHRLMRAHLKREKQCAVCGTTKKLQCHHTTPLWKDIVQAGTDPLRGDDKTCRFMTLCQPCHLRYGHDFDFGHKYVANISIIAACMREVRRSEEVVRRDGHVEGTSKNSGSIHPAIAG